MKNRLITIGLLAFLILESCSGVKNLQKPDLNLPNEIVANQKLDSLTIADLGWWEFYSDPYLKDILTRTLENNKRLQMAAAHVEQAQYIYKVNKAKLLPELNATLPWNYETNDYYNENPLRDPEIGVKATISWEADLWGKISWAKKKSYAQFLSTVEDERAMRMVLVAEAASAYFRLVGLDNELEIVRNTMETREEGVRLAKLRFEGGLTSETVYQQALVQYATAAALIPNLEYNIKVTENVISVLMGAYPGEKIQRAKSFRDISKTDDFPIGLPSTLLERRPDIKSTEYKLMASMDEVGVTYASRFPSLVLTITGGWENDKFKNLFKSPFSYLAENFTAPIFDFGKKKNAYKAAVEAYNEASKAYEQKVLEAFAEVNDALTRFTSSQKGVKLQTELLDAAYKYQDLTWKQYRGGTIYYIDVLDAQRRYLEAQIARTNAIRDQHLAMVQLYKALGGGWKIQQED